MADSRQLQLLEEFEKRKRVSVGSREQVCGCSMVVFLQAKAIVVPTDDSEVKTRLREQGEPICQW